MDDSQVEKWLPLPWSSHRFPACVLYCNLVIVICDLGELLFAQLYVVVWNTIMSSTVLENVLRLIPFIFSLTSTRYFFYYYTLLSKHLCCTTTLLNLFQ